MRGQRLHGDGPEQRGPWPMRCLSRFRGQLQPRLQLRLQGRRLHEMHERSSHKHSHVRAHSVRRVGCSGQRWRGQLHELTANWQHMCSDVQSELSSGWHCKLHAERWYQHRCIQWCLLRRQSMHCRLWYPHRLRSVRCSCNLHHHRWSRCDSVLRGAAHQLLRHAHSHMPDRRRPVCLRRLQRKHVHRRLGRSYRLLDEWCSCHRDQALCTGSHNLCSWLQRRPWFDRFSPLLLSLLGQVFRLSADCD
jgi:hypothetical protein